MSDTYWDDDETAQAANSPKGLRDAYEAQKQKNKEMADQLAQLATEVRLSKLERKFSAKGVPEKAAKLFPKEKSPDEVDAWLEEFGDVLGLKANETPVNPSEPSQVVPPTNPSAAPLEAMNKAVAGAVPATHTDDLETVLARPDLSEEDFLAAIRKAGARV